MIDLPVGSNERNGDMAMSDSVEYTNERSNVDVIDDSTPVDSNERRR